MRSHRTSLRAMYAGLLRTVIATTVSSSLS
jgi:hypothetical protein